MKNGSFKIKNIEKVTGDVLVFEISDKFQPELKSTVKVALDYNKSETLDFYAGNNGANGYIPDSQPWCKNLKGKTGGNGGNGESGADLDVYIEEAKHAVTGATYYKVRINKPGQTLSFYYTVAKGNKINVQVQGGNGGRGGSGGEGSMYSNECTWLKNADMGQGGNGGNGGNGGDLNIILSHSHINYLEVLSINNSAGSGGKGGNGVPEGSAGRNGTRGSVRTSVVSGLNAFSK